MKTIIKAFLLLSISGLTACKKASVPPTSATAAFNFVNAMIGVSPLVVQFNNRPVIFSTLATSNKLNYGAANLFSPLNGNVTIAFIQSTDTTHTLFKGTFELQNYNAYSFFLTGNVNQPDTMLVHDQLPYYAPSDSVGGVRFVNLSTGSNPVSVDIKGQPNGSEVQSLSYKAITGFKAYPATSKVSSYIFEFRDTASGSLLTSYTFSGVNNSTGTNTTTNTFRFKNLTLALIGQPGGTGTAAQRILLINNY